MGGKDTAFARGANAIRESLIGESREAEQLLGQMFGHVTLALYLQRVKPFCCCPALSPDSTPYAEEWGSQSQEWQ